MRLRKRPRRDSMIRSSLAWVMVTSREPASFGMSLRPLTERERQRPRAFGTPDSRVGPRSELVDGHRAVWHVEVGQAFGGCGGHGTTTPLARIHTVRRPVSD